MDRARDRIHQIGVGEPAREPQYSLVCLLDGYTGSNSGAAKVIFHQLPVLTRNVSPSLMRASSARAEEITGSQRKRIRPATPDQ